ncbi:MAG: RsmE family RNA methyltransferase [Pseudomonadota bacterium]
MTPRLLLRGALAPGYRSLDEAAAHYLRTVLRLRTGAEVEVFNGAGARCQAEIVAAQPETEGAAGRDRRSGNRSRRHPLGLELRDPIIENPQPAHRILLGFALLKAPATDEVLRKATELGATDLLPLLTQRTQRGPTLARAERSEHWAAVVSAAAAQCQQDHLPVLHAPAELEHLLAGTRMPFPVAATHRLLLDPTGAVWPAALPPADTALLLGPEGGWTQEELARAEAVGWRVTRLGALVLRAETAPLAALSWLAASWAAQP